MKFWLAVAVIVITAGVQAASDFKIGPDTFLDSLSMSSGNAQYLVTWRDLGPAGTGSQIRGSLIGNTGVVGTDFAISDVAGLPMKASVQRPRVAYDNTNYMVIWVDNRATGAGLRGALVSNTGTVVNGADFLISTLSRTNDIEPQIVHTGIDYIVAWQDAPGSATGTQISYCRVSFGGVAGAVSLVPASGSNILQSLEYLIRGPGNEVLMVYQDGGVSPAVTNAARINLDNSFVGGGATFLFKNDFSATGFGVPVGAAFNGTDYEILSSYGVQIDSSVFKTRLPIGGSPIRPSAPFAEVGQGDTDLAEDNVPRTFFNGTDEYLFLRNTKVSATAYHIYSKRVKVDGTDRDPNIVLVDLASRGVLNGAVAGNLGTQYLITWMDGRRPDAQPSDQVNIYGSLIDGSLPGDEVKPYIKTVARARPIFGNPPLEVSFGTSGSTGIIDAFRWEFGDGATSGLALTTHKYETKGDYIAVLSLLRGGYAVRDFVRILVASDALGGGNGPPETIGGSLGTLSDNINTNVVVSNMSVTLNFVTPGADSVRLAGFFDPSVLPVSLKDRPGNITVAGISYPFTLDANALFVTETGKKPITRVGINRFSGQFVLQSNNNDLAATFAALGAGNETVTKPGRNITFPVNVNFGDLTLSTVITGIYTAKEGKSGLFSFLLGVNGSASVGFMHVATGKATESGKKKGEAVHAFVITGFMGPGGTTKLAKADSGNWRVTLGNYFEDIPVASLVPNGDVLVFNTATKGKAGLTNFFYNTRTGAYGVAMKLVPAEGANPSGMALASSQFSRADMALSFDFDIQGGVKFQNSVFVRFGRTKIGSKKWILR